MNEARPISTVDAIVEDRVDDAELSARERLGLYIAVGLGAGAVIALQIDIMRVFAVGSWAHFGSLVVSLAMLGFGLTSAVMTIAKDWFSRHWRGAATVSLGLFGPLAVAANLYVQRLGFNAIFIVSDPTQKWKLLQMFLAELAPFLAGAVFLGCVFLKSNRTFGRVYFADLAGAGLCGLIFLASMYVFVPANLIAAPLALWLVGCVAWAIGPGGLSAIVPYLLAGALAFGGHFWLAPALGWKTLAVNDYKGVSYARKFPDAKKVYESASPFGYLEAYSSSYLHFAPGLSDNAGFNLPTMPANAYLGLYIDSDGPIGIMRDLTDKETAYFHYLPMVYPYIIKSHPKTFITQFGGGISTEVALHSGATDVTVAEGNRAVLEAFHDDVIRKFTGDILSKVRVIDYEGRHFLAHTDERFDVIDLSLADSVGLSNPGGFAIVEKYSYTKRGDGDLHARPRAGRRAVGDAVEQGGAPEVGAQALCDDGRRRPRGRSGPSRQLVLRVVHLPFDRDGSLQERRFHAGRGRKTARPYTRDMSFDEIYSPGFVIDPSQTDATLSGYVEQIFAGAAGGPPAPNAGEGSDPTAPADQGSDAAPPSGKADDGVLPATVMGRLAWHALIAGDWPEIASRYVFDTRALTNDAPYFAAYVKDRRSASRSRQARAPPGRVGLSVDLGDPRGRLPDGCGAPRHPRPLGLAHHLLAFEGKGANRPLFRLSRRRLHHGRSRPHRAFRHGARQSDHFRFRSDHRNAGVLRPRRLGVGAHPAVDAGRHAGAVPHDWWPIDHLCAVHQSRARRDRGAALRRAAAALLRPHRASRIPHGLPNADRDDDAWQAWQGPHVHLGVGSERLLLRHWRCGGAGHRDEFRARRGDRDCRGRLPARHPCIFRRDCRRRLV